MIEKLYCSGCGAVEEVFMQGSTKDAIEEAGWEIFKGKYYCMDCAPYSDWIEEEVNGRTI